VGQLPTEAAMLKALARTLIPAPVRRTLWRRWQRSGVRVRLDRWAADRLLRATFIKTQDAMTVQWLGKPIWQYPLDLWVIQEIVAETKPDLIVETGTFRGGSAYFLACLCELLDHGQVISIDIAAESTIPHPRITYVQGSSTDPAIIARVASQAAQATNVLVVLDSDHSAAHVLAELHAYAPLIPPGNYVHVQDGIIDETSFFRGKERPGPAVAVRDFLRESPSFVRALEVEHRYIMTAHPYGWLRRVSQ
jgi:cephalosporin hydroxylase